MKYHTSEITANCTVHAVKPLPAKLAASQCPFCGAAHHDEDTRPSVTCTRWLWHVNARLVAACVGLLDAYAPNAQITVDKSGEDSLHSSVRQARAALSAAKGDNP